MMSALRGSSEALRRGGLRVLAAGNGRIAFSRSIGGERVVVCVNHSIGEWVLPAGRVRFAESAAPSPTGEVVLMRGGFCLLESVGSRSAYLYRVEISPGDTPNDTKGAIP